jgi:exodeoxyribonuclease-1
MATDSSFYWYDLETFGIDHRYQRISQFAGVRTDLDLNIIEEPLVMYCKPAKDFLPDPRSCMVTGITPQMAAKQGIPEPDFVAKIHAKFNKPNTCVVGYNNLRFDDEFMRYAFYRNLFDPYEREWKNGNSRWDIIDMVRGTHALRPEGINWPEREEGIPSFRLEELTKANGIAHEHAHDAYSDVLATINMAKLIKTAQSRLYDYVLQNKDKQSVAKSLDVSKRLPVVHVSGMYKSTNGNLGVVMPLTRHPINKNGIIVLDLSFDPEILTKLSIEDIQYRIFTPAKDLPEDMERIPVKTILLNKCPVVVPVNTLTDEVRQRYIIDLEKCNRHRSYLLKHHNIFEKIKQVFNEKKEFPAQDVDESLYAGFFSNTDKFQLEKLRNSTPAEFAQQCGMPFDDRRIPELLFRYRARNYPEGLSDQEKTDWEQFRIDKLHGKEGDVPITVASYLQTIAELRQSEETTTEQMKLLDALEDYLHTELLPDK